MVGSGLGRRRRGLASALLAVLAVCGLAWLLASGPAAAQTAAGEPSLRVRLLLDLLADPEVQAWLAGQRAAAPGGAAEQPTATPAGYVAGRLDANRANRARLAEAAPALPAELSRVLLVFGSEFEERGLWPVLLLVLAFASLGFGLEWLFRWALRDAARWLIARPLDTARQRLEAVAIWCGYGTGVIASFAVGSIGVFLALDWPPLLREIVLGYLFVLLLVRLSLVLGRLVLAPGGERFRILPMTTPEAWFWHRRLGVGVGWTAFGWVSVGLLRTLGVSADVLALIALLFGFGLLLLGLEAVWRRPRDQAIAGQPRRFGGRERALGLSAYFVALFLLWAVGAMPVFALALLVFLLPLALRLAQRGSDHLLQPAAAAEPSMAAALLGRGLRVVLIIAAALLLAKAWQLDLGELVTQDALVARLARGAISALIILLLAELAWQALKVLIDSRLAAAQAVEGIESEEARKRARLRTLLPILRNVVVAVLAGMSVLMALSALGVEIGPLVAGAGVVGVAVGFGAQTLVKDIISGMFFLLDDAFRIGEYIQSGSYKGTVESFSLRSVKLRHHRGPLYTVPFGELSAIQNMSRDWVIDKLTIGVAYDTDLDKARKLIKQVGKELAADPEIAPNIIESLKMQGVEQFGDFAIELRLKLTTKPGQQFMIRRRAFSLIKKAFDANGIKFAFPTVQVAGGETAGAAAARQALDLAAKPAEQS